VASQEWLCSLESVGRKVDAMRRLYSHHNAARHMPLLYSLGSSGYNWHCTLIVLSDAAADVEVSTILFLRCKISVSCSEADEVVGGCLVIDTALRECGNWRNAAVYFILCCVTCREVKDAPPPLT
jgi:hypothetical protein